MLFQAFTAADFSCCLFVGLSAFSFIFSEWNAAQSGRDQEIDSAIAEHSTFLPSKTPGLLLMYVLGHLYYEAPSNQLSAFDWIWADSISLYTSEFIRLLLSSVSSSLNSSNPEPLEAKHAHASHCSTMFQMIGFGSWAVPSLLHTFFFSSFWYRLILISAIQRMLFQKWSVFFRCFLAKSNLTLFAPCGEPSVFALVNLLLIVDFDSDVPASWRVFFTWLDVVKGFFFTMERILRSSITVVLCGRPGLFMLQSSPVRSSFFSECTKLLICPLLMFLLSLSLMDLFCFWSLTIVCFTCLENSFQMQMAHLESTPDPLPA